MVNIQLSGEVGVRHEVHYYYHDDRVTCDTLARIEHKLDQFIAQEGAVSVQLDNLTQAVQRNTDAEAAAADLIRGLATQVSSLEPTQAAIDELSSQLNAQADALAAAVVAGTAAENQPASTPTPAPEPAPNP